MVMKTRVYLKQRKDGSQTLFVTDWSEVFKGERYFNGNQIMRNGKWCEYDMLEKDINRMVKEGRMVRIQQIPWVGNRFFIH